MDKLTYKDLPLNAPALSGRVLLLFFYLNVTRLIRWTVVCFTEDIIGLTYSLHILQSSIINRCSLQYLCSEYHFEIPAIVCPSCSVHPFLLIHILGSEKQLKSNYDKNSKISCIFPAIALYTCTTICITIFNIIMNIMNRECFKCILLIEVPLVLVKHYVTIQILQCLTFI